jgi:hypothetical protein
MLTKLLKLRRHESLDGTTQLTHIFGFVGFIYPLVRSVDGRRVEVRFSRLQVIPLIGLWSRRSRVRAPSVTPLFAWKT